MLDMNNSRLAVANLQFAICTARSHSILEDSNRISWCPVSGAACRCREPQTQWARRGRTDAANVRCNAGPGMMRGKMTIWILLMPPSSNLIFVAFRVRRRTVDIGCGRDVGRQIIANVGPNALNILAYR